MLLGIALDLAQQKDWSRRFVTSARDHGPLYRVRMGTKTMVIVSSPTLARSVLVEGQKNYQPGHVYERPESVYAEYADVFGRALQNATGEAWRWRRRALNPAFQPRTLVPALLHFVVDQARALSRELEDGAGRTVDVDLRMTHLTLEVIARLCFGRDPDFAELGGVQRIASHFAAMSDEFVTRARLPFLKWVPRRGRTRAAQAKRELDHWILAQIDERSHRAPADGDASQFRSLVEDMLRDGHYGRDEIADEITALLFAGHDTTAHTIAFALGLLAQHPEAREAARAEVARVLVGAFDRDSPRPITAEMTGQLPYLTAVIKETLRLYPIAWAAGISNIVDTTLGGHALPAKTDLLLLFRSINEDPVLYPEPARFRPERYLDSELPSFAFSLGAHTCIGKYLAMLEARVVLATLLARHDFRLAPGHVVETDVHATLCPRGGMPMIFSPARS